MPIPHCGKFRIAVLHGAVGLGQLYSRWPYQARDISLRNTRSWKSNPIPISSSWSVLSQIFLRTFLTHT